MSRKSIVAFILILLFLDQAFKYYIKTNYYLGEEHNMLGSWFRLHFVENEGMAWGWKLGESGSWGKIALSVFRLVAVGFGVYYLNDIIKKKQHKGFIICVALIFAGAVGNLIDSLFYGLLFEESSYGIRNVAQFLPAEGGYAGLFHGKVVDMLYFPIVNAQYPTWMPWVGGEPFQFFSPVFNLADACISLGLIIILLFQKRFFVKPVENDVDASKQTAVN